jgi:hypothetical protein
MNTTHEYRGYVFTIAYQPQNPAYIVDFPDIPEITTSGDTLASASRIDLNMPDLVLGRWTIETLGGATIGNAIRPNVECRRL